MVCVWTCQGNLDCYDNRLDKKHSIQHLEHFSSPSKQTSPMYSFNVMVYDDADNVLAKHVFNNISTSTASMILQLRPTNYEQYGDNVKVVITDVTLYATGNAYRPKPLSLLIEIDKNTKPIPIRFSDMPKLSNIYYRTAEISLASYKGFSLYIDTKRL
jgi:hypothetical protein